MWVYMWYFDKITEKLELTHINIKKLGKTEKNGRNFLHFQFLRRPFFATGGNIFGNVPI